MENAKKVHTHTNTHRKEKEKRVREARSRRRRSKSCLYSVYLFILTSKPFTIRNFILSFNKSTSSFRCCCTRKCNVRQKAKKIGLSTFLNLVA